MENGIKGGKKDRLQNLKMKKIRVQDTLSA